MADCSGIWTSKIKWTRKGGVNLPRPLEDPDGQFTIDPHTGTTFTGQHQEPPGNPTVLFNTSCTPHGRDGFQIVMHRLDMTVRPPEQFMYRRTGTIDPDTGDMIITGEVRVPGPPEGGDTGTWEASKPGGGGDDKDKDKDKKDKKTKDRPNEGAVGE